MNIGYTDKQASAMLERIDRRCAKVEDALAELAQTVPDTAESVHAAQEHAREIRDRLARTVARRMREPMVGAGGLETITAELEFRAELRKQKRAHA